MFGAVVHMFLQSMESLSGILNSRLVETSNAIAQTLVIKVFLEGISQFLCIYPHSLDQLNIVRLLLFGLKLIGIIPWHFIKEELLEFRILVPKEFW